MNKTEFLNKLTPDSGERLLLAHVMDVAQAVERRCIPQATDFLSPHEGELVRRLVAAMGYPKHAFSGGYEEAERQICVFLPDWQEGEDYFGGEDCPIAALRCTWRGEDSLTHRDFLGALMGMGVTREKVGDLLVGQGQCDILVMQEIAGFLAQSLESVGRVKVKTAAIPLDQVQPPKTEVKVIHDTVAALRLDAVMAAGFSVSRSKAADLIAAGKAAVNWQERTKPDFAVEEGAVISCRGLGKCRLTQVGGRSRKDRVIITIERYI